MIAHLQDLYPTLDEEERKRDASPPETGLPGLTGELVLKVANLEHQADLHGEDNGLDNLSIRCEGEEVFGGSSTLLLVDTLFFQFHQATRGNLVL